MEPHRLVLGRIDTDCVAMADAEEAASMGARLDRVMRHGLAGALPVAVAPVLDGHEGVLRLKHLRIRLDLGERLDQPGLAEAIAGQIAAALKAQMAKTAPALRHWHDHESYLADYILMRLGLVAQPAWAFPDLMNLDHVPAERAAAELIRARPAMLTALAKAAAACGDAAAPLVSWPVEAKAALVRALVEAPLDISEADHLLPALHHLLTLPLPTRTSPSAGALLGEALALALELLAQEARDLTPRAMVFAAIAALAVRARDAPVPKADGTNSPGGAGAATGADQTAMATVLAFVEADAQRRATLGLLTRVPARRRSDRTEPSSPDERPADPKTAQDALRSPRLGLALLLPSVPLLDAAAHLTPTQLAQVVWQALDPADWAEAAEDPALQMLLPVEPPEIDLLAPQPLPPERLLRGLAVPARKVYDASAHDRRWSALLLADFASRLRGLHGSSHTYLRRQFLDHAGAARRGADQITVLLDPIPLGILLQMAGFPGAQGHLPQSGRPKLILSLGTAHEARSAR